MSRVTICGDVVQLVRTPACHVGGRGFEPRRPRHSFSITYSRSRDLLSPRLHLCYSSCYSFPRNRLLSRDLHQPEFLVLAPLTHQGSLRSCSESDDEGWRRMPIAGLEPFPIALIATRWIRAFFGSSSLYRQLFRRTQTDGRGFGRVPQSKVCPHSTVSQTCVPDSLFRGRLRRRRHGARAPLVRTRSVIQDRALLPFGGRRHLPKPLRSVSLL